MTTTTTDTAAHGCRGAKKGIPMKTPNDRFHDEADARLDAAYAAIGANLARYVYDDHGSYAGRCTGHDRGDHHPLCPQHPDNCRTSGIAAGGVS